MFNRLTPKQRTVLIRGARTFMFTFGGVVLQKWIASAPEASITGLVNVVRRTADTAAGSGLIAALFSAGANITRPISPETSSGQTVAVQDA
jgi:hypothetical protein